MWYSTVSSGLSWVLYFFIPYLYRCLIIPLPIKKKVLLASWGVRGMRKSVRKIWNTVPACVCWIIWKERNARCFEGKIEGIPKIKYTCLWFWLFGVIYRMFQMDSMLDFDSLRSRILCRWNLLSFALYGMVPNLYFPGINLVPDFWFNIIATLPVKKKNSTIS